jgi:SNF2 family DNA or RNA helicase
VRCHELEYDVIAALRKLAELVTPLKPHQSRVVERLKRPDQPGLVVAHGLGSGKTLTSIAAQDALGMKADVVVPAALQANYDKERTKHLGGDAQPIRVSTLQGIARGGLSSDANPLLIVDEAHRARETGTKAYQALAANQAERRMLLTASPFYNRPSDIAPLINIAAGKDVLPGDPTAFRQRYLTERSVSPGFFGRLRGLQPGVVEELNQKRKGELQAAFKDWVDYHPNSTEGFPDVKRESVEVEMTPQQLKVYDSMMGTAPSWVAAKIKKGLPPSKQESKNLNAFVNAARQVSNTTGAFAPDADPQAPKIDAAFQRLQRMRSDNPNARAVVYSNYLQSGINPYKERLTSAGIPFGEFTGELPKAVRDQRVSDYNSGKTPVLLLSSAGGEGLDLKGTRLIQMLEPHWNAEKMKQLEGRGIRYQSHADLPEADRNVLVESYLATRPKPGAIGRFFGRKQQGSVDQYLSTMSSNKERLLDQVRALLPQEPKATGG